MYDKYREDISRGKSSFPFQLYKVTHIYHVGDLMARCHWHPEAELIYVMNENITLSLNGNSYDLGEGEFAFINSEYFHEFYANSKKACYLAFVFPLEFLGFDIMDYTQKQYIDPIIKKEILFPTTVSQESPAYPLLKQEIIEIIDVNQNDVPGYELATKTSIYKIICHLVRYNLLLHCTSTNHSIYAADRDELKKVLVYIDNHSNEKISLDTISSHFGMSSSYFCRYFKENFGVTLTDYINSHRIERACKLLKSTKSQVIDIAYAVGFNNVSYFNRKFFDKIGMTPLKYRNAKTDM